MSKKKTATMELDTIKCADGWCELVTELGLRDQLYDIFEYGEYGSLTIEVDKNLNIIGGKIHRFKVL